MEAEILYKGCTFQELAQAVAEILISEKFNKAKKEALEVELISRDEVCKLLHFNKTTLHKHTKSGLLTSYSVGGRVLYKRAEVLAVIK